MLGAEIRKMKPGQTVVLKIERDGKPMEVKVKLGEYSEDNARKEMELRFPGIFPPMGPQGGSDNPQAQPSPPGQQQPSPGQPPSSRRRMPGFRSQTPFPSMEMRKYIGLYCRELNPELASYFGVKEGTGLIVARLTENGPAQKAHLRVGDVIVRVEGKRVGSANDLIDLIQDKKKGDKIKVEILREKKPMTMEVVVEEEKVDGGDPSSGDFRSFLQSWQGYTEAFQNELRRWQNEYAPEFRANLKEIGEDLAQRSKESFREIKTLFKPRLKKV
jgi:hypothetical protein